MNNIFKNKYIVDGSKTISILDMDNDIYNYELDFVVNENSKLNLNISVIAKNKNKKIIINIYHLGDNSTSECHCNGLSKSSFIDFSINSKIDKNTKNNYCVQNINGILLDKISSIKGNPNLIINTNKIKASHRLAIGKINENKLFYLMSKGIEKIEAILLLTNELFTRHYSICDDEKIEKIKTKIKEIYESI